MNAVNSEMPLAARAPVAAPHPTHTFRLLLRREFWEHRGGFLRAPLVAGAIFLLLTIMGLGIGEMAANRLAHTTTNGTTTSSHGININGSNVAINGLNLGKLTQDMSPEDMRQLGGVVDVSLYGAAIWPFIALAFVVFFYCLGSLYDDRKDRSVLFWKSLPVSDAQTVWSKVASATLVAPALAMIAAVATVIGFLTLSSVVVMFHGGNPITLLWGPGSPLTVMGHLIASVPVYAIWALPTVGWLMLCSAWAPSKPFLWAVMIPVFAGIFVSWFDLMQLFNMDTVWFWKNVVARALLSTVPGSWFDVANFGNGALNSEGPGSVGQLINLRTIYSVLATAQAWIGAAVGVVMILVSIRLRRWRDEG